MVSKKRIEQLKEIAVKRKLMNERQGNKDCASWDQGYLTALEDLER